MDRAIIRYLILLVLLTYPAIGEIRKVPADYPTIQAAIDASTDADTILVAPGTYTGDGNRDIDFKGRAIKLRSEAGPETCIIDCNGTEQDPHRGFYFHNGEDNSILQGFTVTNGHTMLRYENGGGILCLNSNPKIIDCVISGNKALHGAGGGIATVCSSVQIIDCLIRNNVAADGGGIYITTGGMSCNRTVFIKGCIIAGNHAVWNPRYGGEGGGIIVWSSCDIVNCTITGNFAGYSGGGICFRQEAYVSNCIVWSNNYQMGYGKEIAVMYQCVSGGGRDSPVYYIKSPVYIENSLVGSGSIDDFGFTSKSERCVVGQWLQEDPHFVSTGHWGPSEPNSILQDISDYFWVDGDYHLKSQAGRWDPNSQSWVIDDVTSPCIDAGDPNTPIGDEPFPNGGIINMGAYGGSAEASKSYFGEPVCETIIAGDINGDCKVDFKDFKLMALHWLEQN